MHIFMNFIHATAIIVSDIKEVLAGTYVSVDRLLNGKKYPQYFRVLRMLYCDVEQEPAVVSFTRLIEVFEARANCSRTTNMLSDNLVKTAMVMMNFSRVRHEGDWALQLFLFAAEAMLPLLLQICTPLCFLCPSEERPH